MNRRMTMVLRAAVSFFCFLRHSGGLVLSGEGAEVDVGLLSDVLIKKY